MGTILIILCIYLLGVLASLGIIAYYNVKTKHTDDIDTVFSMLSWIFALFMIVFFPFCLLMNYIYERMVEFFENKKRRKKK